MKGIDEQTAVAVVFANTKRKKRTGGFVTVAEAFDHLVKVYGSQRAVAKKVGLSPGNREGIPQDTEFTRKSEGTGATRKIDRLDVAYRISMLPSRDEQINAARQSAGLLTDDIRDVNRLVSTTGISPEESKKKVLKVQIERPPRVRHRL